MQRFIRNGARRARAGHLSGGNVEVDLSLDADYRVGGIEDGVILSGAVLHIRLFGSRHFKVDYAVFVRLPVHAFMVLELIDEGERDIRREAEFEIYRVVGKYVVSVFIHHPVVSEIFVGIEVEPQPQKFFRSQKPHFDSYFADRVDITRKVHSLAADGSQNGKHHSGAYSEEEAVRAKENVKICRKLAGAFRHVPQ